MGEKNIAVSVVTRSGTTITLEQWQGLYGLKVGSTEIGKYFCYTESRFARDIAQYGMLVVNELLIRVLDRYRERKKGCVNLNSFNRDQDHQDTLTKNGNRTATTSPHVVKLAADADTPGLDEIRDDSPELDQVEAWRKAVEINREQVRLLRLASKELNIMIRIGNEQYLRDGSTFVHVDVCPEYYAPGKPYHKHPHPLVWEKSITW